MKKTLLNSIPNEMPHDIQRFVSAANIYDSSCSPEANVYFIDKGNGYYLKCSDRGMLEKESRMTEYFHSKGFGAEVLHYISDDRDWLLTSAVTGEDCLHEGYLADPKRLCDTIAYELRRLHETDYTDCPNIILNNWKLSGFIDVGNGGVGDRHIDIFWGVWTLWFNLKTDKYCARFLDAYGRDKADESVLKIVAAAEVFG